MIAVFYEERARNRGRAIGPTNLIRAMQIFRLPGVCELFCSDTINSDFAHAMNKVLETASYSYRTQSIPSYILPLAIWMGILDIESEVRWKRNRLKYTVQKPIKSRIPAHAEMRAVIDHIARRHDVSNVQQTAYDTEFATLLVTGCRIGQMVALTMDDVTLGHDGSIEYIQFRFIAQKTLTRTHHTVQIPLGIELAKGLTYARLIHDWMNVRDQSSNWFFYNSAGGQFHPRSIARGIETLFKKVTGKAAPPHAIRAYAITLMANSSGIEDARKLAGHSNHSTTAKYHDPWNGLNTSASLTEAFKNFNAPQLGEPVPIKKESLQHIQNQTPGEDNY